MSSELFRACLFGTFPLAERSLKNKLAKARKTRKSPGTLGLKKFGPGKLRVEKVWAQNIFIDFLANILENIFVNF